MHYDRAHDVTCQGFVLLGSDSTISPSFSPFLAFMLTPGNYVA